MSDTDANISKTETTLPINATLQNTSPSEKTTDATEVVEKTVEIKTEEKKSPQSIKTEQNNKSNTSNKPIDATKFAVTPKTVEKKVSEDVLTSAQEQTNKTNPLISAIVGQPLINDVTLEIFRRDLNNYKTNLAPAKPVSKVDGAKHQIALWSMFKRALNIDAKDFNMVWSEILNFVNENRDHVFHDSKVFRFFDALKLSKMESKNFERIMHLAISTANPSTRKTVINSKQLDLKTILSNFDEKVKQKLESFYTTI